MTRLLKEPLLHFLVLGAALFGLFNLVNQKEAEQSAKIVVSAKHIENLSRGFASTWRRLPGTDELRGLIEEHIREEISYREAKALGLDLDDTVIRRRLRQKLEFVTEDMASVEPTDEQLSAYLTSNVERFKSDDRLTFTHVFLSATRPDGLGKDAESIAATLGGSLAGKDVAELGDNFLLGHEFRNLARRDVAGTFGEPFAEKISKLEQGRWQGPVASNYGLHFVRISEKTQGGLITLDAVRAAVRREWMNERRVQAENDLYRTLRERYQIVVEPLPGADAASMKLSGIVQ